LEAGTSTGTRVHGQELVVWRDITGAAHVWEDRCPHRGMRLSFGFVRGQHIACLYHGWQFDAQAQCRLIPAHPDITVPKTIRATRYGAIERLGMVWVELPVDANAAALEDEAPVTTVRSLTIAAAPELVAAEWAPGVIVQQEVEGLRVLAGVQPLCATETAVHLVIAGTADASARKRVATWGMALRTRLEAST
jgi:nitrite reductase/ring-hydroxylating ferredoxin subunit